MSENDVRIYVSKKEMNKIAGEFAGTFDAVMRQRHTMRSGSCAASCLQPSYTF